MARKKKEEEHVNHERWLISYADFITLLFAFFVVMYAVSSINEGKYRVLSDSMVSAFHATARSLEPIQIGEINKSQKQPGLIKSIVDQGSAPVAFDKITVSPFKESSLSNAMGKEVIASNAGRGDKHGSEVINQMADKIEKAMSGLIQKDLIAVRRNDNWIEVEIKTSILFPSGSAKLQENALPVLDEMAGILKGFPNPIRVEGFTDNVPINTVAFPSNWELSAGRAASVVHLFTKDGVEPRRMASIGFGEYRPMADNSTPEGRNRNRRVVIVILESEAAERLFSDRSEMSDNGKKGDGDTPQANIGARASVPVAVAPPSAALSPNVH
jgi:chemotaxis protein MotB